MRHSIRQVVDSDSEAYETFLSALFAENLDTLVPRSSAATAEQCKRFIAAHNGEQSALFLAESEGHILGTINLTRIARPELDHAVSLGLNVAANSRGKGIGRSLLVHGLQWSREAEHVHRIELDVLANNAPAIHLYEAVGFACEGVKRNAIKRGSQFLDILVYGYLFPEDKPAAPEERYPGKPVTRP